MKKILLSLTCLALVGTIYASDHGWMFSVKQGYFVPQSDTLRDMFKCSGGPGGYFVEGALRWDVYKGLNLELNSSYFGHNGRALATTITTSSSCVCHSSSCSSGCCSSYRIEFKMPTVGFGLKYFYCFHNRCNVFIGGGIKGFFVRIKNESPYVPCHDNSSAVGGFVHAGLLFDIYKGLFLEVFADYLGSRLDYPCEDCSSCQYKLDVSGFAGGLGIGYKF